MDTVFLDQTLQLLFFFFAPCFRVATINLRVAFISLKSPPTPTTAG